jgi:hypothetical protein
MTPTRHITRLILLQVAFLLIGVCHDVGCVAHAGDIHSSTRRGRRSFAVPQGASIAYTRRMTRITVLRPIRAQGRAAAGYPFLQTTANVTRVAANLSGLINPIGWFF